MGCLYVHHSLVVRCLDFCLVSCPLVDMLSGYWANNYSPLVGRNGNEILDGMLGSNLICFQVSCVHSTLSQLCTVADGNIDLLSAFHINMYKSLDMRCQGRRSLSRTNS